MSLNTQLDGAPGSSPGLLRLWTRLCVVVGVAFFTSQLLEIPARSALRGYDNTFNYLWLRSAMVDHDWDFRNDLEACNTLAHDHRTSALTLPKTAAGRIPNKYGIGWAVVSLPFYLVADGIVALGRALGLWSLDRDGYNAVYQVCLQFGHLALALSALGLAVKSIGQWLGSREAACAGVVAVWAASPLFYYQTVNLSMSHGVAFFAAATMAYALTRARAGGPAGGPSSREIVSVTLRAAASREPGPPAETASQELGPPTAGDAARPSDFRWWLLAGAGWGLATTTRFQLGALGIVVVAALLERGPARERRETPAAHAANHERVNRLGGVLLGAAPFILLQLAAWRAVYGEWLVFSYGAEGEIFHWGRPEWWNSFFSAWHGLFYWHPLLLAAAAGMIGWAWRGKGLAVAWLGAFLVVAYVNAAWWCWWFASAFGNRAYDAALLPLMAGAAWWFHRLDGRWARVAGGVAIAAGCWNFYLALLYRTGAISRSEPVTWLEMLAAAARLPGAAQF